MGDTSTNIKIAFLNDVFKEEVYIEQPLGVETHDRKTHLCKLKNALYKLNRHPWDNTYMRSLKITKRDEHLNLCYKVEDEIL